MRAEEMKPFVRVFREHQTREQTRRLFRLLRLGRRSAIAAAIELRFLALPVFLVGPRLDWRRVHRLEIHFAIRGIEERKLAGQTFA
jgi:hypothetical protein